MSDLFPDVGARRWLLKYVKKNFWRVAAWIDYDDLIQDGYVAYYETRMRYPTATEPAHIMWLFQLVFRSKIEDLVRANTNQVDDARSDLVETIESPNMIIPDFSNFHALLVKAPELIKEALSLLIDEQARNELTTPFVKHDNGRRETMNDRMCRLLGKDPNCIDIVGQLRTYFS